MKKLIALLALLMLLLPMSARAETYPEDPDGAYDDSQVYQIYDTQGNYLTSRAGQVSPQDEYIAGDNKLYRILEADPASGRATAEYLGYEPANTVTAFGLALPASAQEARKVICMYSTHSDESYEPTDGTSSKTQDAGIYDVGDALKKNLEERGIQVTYSQDTFLPHDAGAYRRSRSTAEDLLKQAPAALLDLHRDGIPDPSEYEHQLEGQDVTKVRLLVGRSNANADANRAFAKEIKAVADEKYPGLIKDIYIGKGNYNQELYPKALLLEFGTHTTDKEEAIQSTQYMADVLDDVLFGGTAQAASAQEGREGFKGAAWLIGGAVLAAVIYVLASSGTFKNLGQRLSRGASQLTGGLMGKKPKDGDE